MLRLASRDHVLQLSNQLHPAAIGFLVGIEKVLLIIPATHMRIQGHESSP